MKINLKDNNDFIIYIDSEDIGEAAEIARLMEMPGWDYLQKYLWIAREIIVLKGKDGIGGSGSKELSEIRWAMLKGLEEAIRMPKLIVDQAQQFLKEKDDIQKETLNDPE